MHKRPHIGNDETESFHVTRLDRSIASFGSRALYFLKSSLRSAKAPCCYINTTLQAAQPTRPSCYECSRGRAFAGVHDACS